MKKKESDFLKFFNRHFHVIIYCAYFIILSFLTFQAGLNTLLQIPGISSEQYRILEAADNILQGKLPSPGYQGSPLYTACTALAAYLSYGTLSIMRIIFISVYSFIPVYVYKLTRRLRFGRENAQIAAFMYSLYGAAAVCSVNFFPEPFISLLFLLYLYFLHKAVMRKFCLHARWGAAVTAAGCIASEISMILPVVLPFLFICFFTPAGKRIPTRYWIRPLLISGIISAPFLYYGIAAEPHFSLSLRSSSPFLLSSFEQPGEISYYVYSDIIEFMRIFIVPFTLPMILALTACLLGKRRSTALFFIISALFPFFLIVALSASSQSTRIPALPLLCILSGGAVYLIRTMKSKSAALIAATAAACYVWYTYIPPDSARSAADKRFTATVLTRSGRYEKAGKYLERLESEGIPATGEWFILIRTVARTGDVQWALELESTFIKYFRKRTKHKLIIPIDPWKNR